jgi:hypothetical protein
MSKRRGWRRSEFEKIRIFEKAFYVSASASAEG